MDYNQLLEKAIQLACERHSGQVDKGGNPYILHPLRVMFNTRKEYYFWQDKEDYLIISIVAVLHDVIECSDLSHYDLIAFGFNAPIINTLYLLTKKETDNYQDYINRIAYSKDKVAMIVKIFDLRDNQDVSRLQKPLSEADFERIRRYRKAEDQITTAMNNSIG